MPITASRLFIATVALSLSACGGAGNSSAPAGQSGGGSAARQAALDTQIAACVESAQRAGQAPAGVDLRQVCGCAINSIADGKSDSEVQAIFSRAPAPDEIAKTRTCMLEAVAATRR